MPADYQQDTLKLEGENRSHMNSSDRPGSASRRWDYKNLYFAQ